MKEVPVAFRSKGKQVVGMLHLPNKRKPPVVVMLHGWAMGKVGNPQFTFVRAAREFCRRGFSVLRFDFRGVGDSEGSFDDYTQKSMIEDFASALEFLKTLKQVDSRRIGVLGWSMGGSTAILGAPGVKEVKCVVSWASPADDSDLWPPAQLEELKKRKKMIIDLNSGLATTWKPGETNYKPYKEIRKLRVPVLIINGTEDTLVYPNQAEKLYKNANRPKKLVLIKGAHHGFYGEDEKRQLLNETFSWFRRWLK